MANTFQITVPDIGNFDSVEVIDIIVKVGDTIKKEDPLITLESDKPLPITQQILTNPDRLVVDVQGLELNPTLKDLVAKVKPNDPYVSQIRVGQF